MLCLQEVPFNVGRVHFLRLVLLVAIAMFESKNLNIYPLSVLWCCHFYSNAFPDSGQLKQHSFKGLDDWWWHVLCSIYDQVDFDLHLFRKEAQLVDTSNSINSQVICHNTCFLIVVDMLLNHAFTSNNMPPSSFALLYMMKQNC